MTVDDRNRLNLLKKLESVLGDEEANTLMEHLPPVTWNHVATNAHVDEVGQLITADLLGRMNRLGTELRGEMANLGTELRSEMNQLRIEMRSEMAQLRTEVRSEVNDMRIEMNGEMTALRRELRGDMTELGAGLRIEMERGFRRQIMWLGTLGTAWFGIAVTLLQLTR